MDELVALARSAASPAALTYHYEHQAQRSFTAAGEVSSVRLKSYCYSLRSALAIAWIRHRGEAPPMNIEALMAGLALPADLAGSIRQLIARKLVAAEDAAISRSSVLDAFITDALSAPGTVVEATNRKEISARADAFLRAQVLDCTGLDGVATTAKCQPRTP